MKHQRIVKTLIVTLVLILINAAMAFASAKYPNCPYPLCGHSNSYECVTATGGFIKPCTDTRSHFLEHHNPTRVTPCRCECCKITHGWSNTTQVEDPESSRRKTKGPDAEAILAILEVLFK